MSATPTFYILHGDDSIGRDAALARMREAMGEDGDLNRSEFDGAQTSAVEILAAVKSLPFLAEKRLVIAKGLISHISRRGAGQAGKTATDRLVAELPNLPDFARLVLVEGETLKDGNRVLKAARTLENGYVRAYRKPRNLTQWIRERARQEYDAEISPRAAQAIASLVNDDLLVADNELHKLVCYVDGEREIGEEDVAALTPYVPEAKVFDMVDALAVGDGARALELMHRSLHHDPKDPGFRLFTLIVRQFRLLSMTREHLDRGGGAQGDAIAKVLGLHPYAAGKLATQARRFNAGQLDLIIKRLQRYDQDMKTGRIEPRLAMELLVTSLAQA
ncbi:MAG: DNA polymerase III subunit delta [Chloroflexota bacterium]|nr:DNA polymerase III subunit delta [Chloroflexota bacterium]